MFGIAFWRVRDRAGTLGPYRMLWHPTGKATVTVLTEERMRKGRNV